MTFFYKLVFLLLAYLVHGPIFEGTPDYCYAFIVLFALIFADARSSIRITFFMLAVVLGVSVQILPTLSIPEQSLILMDEPEDVMKPFQSFRTPQDFLEAPETFRFSPSADGYLQGFADKRLVSTINHEGGVQRLRSGYANHLKYSVHEPGNKMNRPTMPYVLRYQVTPQMVGMVLHAQGYFVFEGDPRLSSFSKKTADIIFKPQHVGHMVTGFGGTWDTGGVHDLHFSLTKTVEAQIYDALKVLCVWGALIFLFLSLFKMQVKAGHRMERLLFEGTTLFFLLFFKDVFSWGLFDSGRVDGIRHAGYPYMMLEALIAGDLKTALMSPEEVFYFMPGMRYVRFLEMMLFGDSYVLQLCFLVAVPVILFRFYHFYLGRYFSAFLAVFTTVFYVKSWMKHYGEWLSYGLLFCSLNLMIRKIKRIDIGLLCFFMLAIAMSIRPNLAVFVGILTLTHLFTPLFSDQKFTQRLVMTFGLIPLMLIPLHNIWGGEFVLVTSASNLWKNQILSPHHYIDALTKLFGLWGEVEGAHLFQYYVQRMWPLYLPLLGLAGYLSVVCRDPQMRVLAFASFAGLCLHLFYPAQLRFLLPYLTICGAVVASQIFSLDSYRRVKNSTLTSGDQSAENSLR